MSTLYLDTETFSETKITHGAYRYAEDAEVMLVAWACDDEPVAVWDTQDLPLWRHALQNIIDKADRVVIHNSNFDRTVLREQGVHIPVEKIVDTMVLALQHSLPGSLGQLCDVLNVPQDKAKDTAGKKLIHLLTKPRPSNVKIRRATRDTHPAEWAAFVEYARLDVDAMRSVLGRLPSWNDSDRERLLWQCDQRINDRGVAVDREFARAAIRAFDRAGRSLAARAAHLTGGSVTSATQRQRLLDHLKEAHGFEPEDLTRGTLGNLLGGDLDPQVRELLEIRQQAAATSPAKYGVLINATNRDGRLRGLIQFCGAARTGRDAGRLFQPQNLPRSPDWFDDEVQATTVAAMKADCEHLIWDNVSERCAFAVRGALVAPEGTKLVIADLSNIEGRVLAWLAGEEWKVAAFKAYDRGEGHDLYKVTAGRILGKDPGVITKAERQSMGKVPELACLGPDTRVLTNSGVKAIIEVGVDDLLWDGEEWVRHEGLIDRGNRSTIWLEGLELTPDHEVLVGQTWQQAQTVVSCQNTRDHALVTGMVNLPWSAWNSGLWAAYERLKWRVHVAQNLTAWLSATCEKGEAHAATAAPRKPQVDGQNNGSDTLTSARTTHTVAGYATVYPRVSTVVITPTMGLTTITEDAASTSTRRGGQTEQLISRTLSLLTDGIDLNSKLTELMSTGVTSRAISVSSEGEPIVTTCDVFGICSNASKNLRPVYDIANAGPRNRFTVLTDSGALIVHNCGYQGGVGAFRQMGGSIVGAMTDAAIQEIVTAWRKAHPRTRNLWYDMEAAARSAINNLGESFAVRGLITFDVKADAQGIAWLRMKLPSGRYLCYPHPQVSDSASLSYEGINQYTRKWQRLDTYGGKLCIAGGTPVLTDAGWLPIEQVTVLHKVWDGVEWVGNEGLARKGVKGVISVNGVWMTPDHEVLTTKGWVRASQSEGLERADPRIPDGCEVPREQRSPVSVAASMPVRICGSARSDGNSETAEARHSDLLRLHAEQDHIGEADNSRDVGPQSVRGVAQHDQQVLTADPAGLGTIRRAWNNGVRSVAEILHRLLGRYGIDLPRGAYAGAEGQRCRILAGKLRMGHAAEAGAEQTHECAYQHTVGADDCRGSGGSLGPEQDDIILSSEQRSAGTPVFRGTRYVTEVYDLVNCGPRSRFVVAGEDGKTLIVHNCENAVQAIARDVFMHGMLRAEEEGYSVCIRVHDELVCETPDEPAYSSDGLAALMATNPSWSAGLPLAAAGFEAYRYRKD